DFNDGRDGEGNHCRVGPNPGKGLRQMNVIRAKMRGDAQAEQRNKDPKTARGAQADAQANNEESFHGGIMTASAPWASGIFAIKSSSACAARISFGVALEHRLPVFAIQLGDKVEADFLGTNGFTGTGHGAIAESFGVH